MGELLKKIISLRNEINNLSKLSNEKVYEYCQLAIKIVDTEEEIVKIASAINVLDNDIVDFKLKKGILYSSPVGVTLSVIFFAAVIITCLDNLSLGTTLFAILGTPTLSISIAFMLSSFLMHSKIFSNFLIKKYAHFKKMNDELNNLIVRNRITENSLTNIKNKKEEITNTISNNGEILESKEEELSKLEQDYFNNIMNNPITNGTTYNISATGKKRTLTRGNSYR